MYFLEAFRITIHEDNFPTLYPCPICQSPLHFADGFIFCTLCPFAREESVVEIVREFESAPDPRTGHWNPDPIYFCEKDGKIPKKSRAMHRAQLQLEHLPFTYTFAKEYRFCGGTHATFKIFPFLTVEHLTGMVSRKRRSHKKKRRVSNR